VVVVWQQPPEWPALSGGAVVLLLAFVGFHFLLEPLRWRSYLGAQGRGTLMRVARVLLGSAFLSYIFPAKLGLPFRYLLLNRTLSLSSETVVANMALDSALTLVIWCLASLYVFVSYATWLIAEITAGVYHWAVLFTAIMLMMVILLGTLARTRGRGYLRRVAAAIRAHSRLVIAFAALVIAFDVALYVLRHSVILHALNEPSPGWQAMIVISVLSVFAGMLCMLPMGLVGYDAAAVMLLAYYGVDLATAAMVPVANRLANLAAAILLGIPSLWSLGLRWWRPPPMETD
jgi:uncharacterized membrane protein YbhN (UPF0104 family)